MAPPCGSCSRTAADVYTALRKQQQRALPAALGISSLTALAGTVYCPEHRAVVMNWMLEVGTALRWRKVVPHSAAHLLDLVVVNNISGVPLDQLQLLAIACLWVTIKVRESMRRAIGLQPASMLQLACGIYSLQDLMDAEQQVLQAVCYSVSPPPARSFLDYHLEAAPGRSAAERALLARCSGALLDRALPEAAFLEHWPSVVGAAALFSAELIAVLSGQPGGSESNGGNAHSGGSSPRHSAPARAGGSAAGGMRARALQLARDFSIDSGELAECSLLLHAAAENTEDFPVCLPQRDVWCDAVSAACQ
eukprot:TRINITY_DN5593_c0_g1_i1.p1 TRINITY_DN5593_c0_g1~~TRINITY_DN5593_c0_g1_i1.p1  ORF type:complete len:332 (+),score=103.78 TRINITY_DN5593_c0_g1_i1:73-996(+)